MKRLLLVLFVSLCWMSIPLHAQNVTPKDKSGDKALLFSINGFGNFGVGSLVAGNVGITAGSTVSFSSIPGAGIRYYLADRLALRAIAGIGTRSDSDPGDTIIQAESSTFQFAVSPGIEVHMINAGPVSGYIGGQISFASATETSSSTVPDSANPLVRKRVESSTSGSGFGVGAFLGAEFFPWTNISLGAEYQVNFFSLSTSAKDTKGVSTDGPKFTTLAITSAAVFLGIYF